MGARDDVVVTILDATTISVATVNSILVVTTTNEIIGEVGQLSGIQWMDVSIVEG